MIAELNESMPVPRAAEAFLHHGATDLPLLSGLDAGLVPLREFPLRKWYYASPLWYYHRPAHTHQLSADPKFYELVDPSLRDLCALALQHGLATTPSCQGHFYGQDRFEAIWRELREGAARIRSDGLRVKDSETDQEYLFCDSAYALPWPDFDAFYAEAAGHQSKGYIGLAIPRQREELAARLAQDGYRTSAGRIAIDEELSSVLGQPIFGIEVNPRSMEERDREWAVITTYLHGVLSAVSGPHPAPPPFTENDHAPA